ncbi:MAG: response regulator transcription factor [Acidobacteria bacterium]|nr:response regulator transcription factor [Acidobacteriota bacterium]MBV9479094.1 response regulator transcription factor [Acidobacteriota bacterium]
MTDAVRVVIADDEPLARRALREHLRHVDWVGRVDEAADGLSAVRLVDELRPDLVFLDVVMPGLSGVEAAEQFAHRPHIIFTTAYDRYAVTAFELGALDYLLKPFGRERVLGVLDRARVALQHGVPRIAARASQVLRQSMPVSSIYVKERGRLLRIPADRVQRLEACDDYVAVHADGKRHLMNARLGDLHARLDPARFVRVHRSHVINVDFIDAVETGNGSRLVVVLRDATCVTASRSGSAQLRSLVVAGVER